MTRLVGDETVILDLVSGTYFGLNPVGTRIWQLLAEGRTLEQVGDAILAEYEVSRDAMESDLAQLLQELRNRKLIESRSEGQGV
jgi:hypothetical protein